MVEIAILIYLALPNYLRQGDHYSFSQSQRIPHYQWQGQTPPPPIPSKQARLHHSNLVSRFFNVPCLTK